MPDYSNGKIYAIRSPHTEEVYIGSTVSTLSKRMGQHREKYNKWKKGEHHYFTCFKLLDLGDAYIELIEEYPCENKNQLERREGQIMRETVNCVNKHIPGQTRREYREMNKDLIIIKKKIYYEENKEAILEKQKEHYEANKEVILERNKEWREANKEVISERNKEYRDANKEVISEKHKKYREANIEVISEKMREYYENNKEKIKAHKSKLIVCECGAEITTSVKARHLKSKKHTDKLLILKD